MIVGFLRFTPVRARTARPHRARWAAGAIAAAACALALAPSAWARAQESSDAVLPDAEAEFVWRINDLRASEGLPPLRVDSELTNIARRWSRAMAEAGEISHNPDFAEQVTADWQKLGENVGSGGDVKRIHDAFVASGTHYRNLVDVDFTLVGIGVVRAPDGVLYTSHQFMHLRAAAAEHRTPPPASQGPTSQGAAASAGASSPASARAPGPSTTDASPDHSERVDLGDLPAREELARSSADRNSQSEPVTPRRKRGVVDQVTGEVAAWNPFRVGVALVLSALLMMIGMLLDQRLRRPSRRGEATTAAGIDRFADRLAQYGARSGLAGWSSGLQWRPVPTAVEGGDAPPTTLTAHLAPYNVRWLPTSPAADATGNERASLSTRLAPYQVSTPVETPPRAGTPDNGCTLRVGPGGTVIEAGHSFATSIGHSVADLKSRRLADLAHPDDLSKLTARPHAAPPASSPALARFRHRDGSWRHFEVDVLAGAGTSLVIEGTDVTERIAVEAEMLHLAQHDRPTGLPHRFRLRGWLSAAARRADAGSAVVIYVVGLRGLEAVREMLGDDAIDRIVAVVADRLAGVAKATDLLVRLTDSALLLARQDIADANQALDVGAELLATTNRCLAVTEHATDVSATIGVAVAEDARTTTDVVRRAYVAARAAHRGARGSEVYRPELEPAARRPAGARRLREAIERDELVLHYQPIVDLRTSVVAGVEALIRWHQPGKGLLGPAEFLPLAEDAGFAPRVTHWVLREACEALAALERRGRRSTASPYISVNVGASEFADPGFLENVDDALARASAPPTGLVLEITEREMLSDEAVVSGTFQALKARGVRLAVDDFGTGHSSLANLKRVPADLLKIDRSLVRDIHHVGSADPIVAAVIGLGRSLSLTTVAEGVETALQIEHLRDTGCDYAQGYFYAPALPLSALDRVLESRPAPRLASAVGSLK